MSDAVRELVERITTYLGMGGLFNPEMMDHQNVRDLLMDCRSALVAVAQALDDIDAGTDDSDAGADRQDAGAHPVTGGQAQSTAQRIQAFLDASYGEEIRPAPNQDRMASATQELHDARMALAANGHAFVRANPETGRAENATVAQCIEQMAGALKRALRELQAIREEAPGS